MQRQPFDPEATACKRFNAPQVFVLTSGGPLDSSGDPDDQAHPVVNMTHHAQERQIFLSVRGTNTDLCRRCSAVGGKPTQAMEAGITDHVAQLIRGSTDEHFWSDNSDRELRDVFAVQSELARSIAEKVQVTVTGAEHARLTAARPVA